MRRNLREARCLDGPNVILDLDNGKSWRLSELEFDLDLHPDPESLAETLYYRSPGGRWFVDVAGLTYEMGPLALFRRFVDDLLVMPDELREDASRALATQIADGGPQGAPIELRLDGSIVVVNRVLRIPQESRMTILRAVVSAYPLGLSEDELKAGSGREGAVSIFKGLRTYDTALRQVLICPERKGRGGYRCEWPWKGAA